MTWFLWMLNANWCVRLGFSTQTGKKCSRFSMNFPSISILYSIFLSQVLQIYVFPVKNQTLVWFFYVQTPENFPKFDRWKYPSNIRSKFSFHFLLFTKLLNSKTRLFFQTPSPWIHDLRVYQTFRAAQKCFIYGLFLLVSWTYLPTNNNMNLRNIHEWIWFKA